MNNWAIAVALLIASAITWAQPPNWSISDAVSTASSPAIAAEVDRLLSLTAIYSTAEILRELDAVATADWNAAQVDRIYEQYAIGLRSAFPDTVTSAALHHLASYEARALVPHPDNDGYGVPAFHVRAAVAGTQSHWEYQQAFEAALHALQTSDPWLFAELAQAESSEVRIAAINAVLASAHPTEVASIVPGIQLAVDMRPEAGRLLITAAARTGDLELIQWLSERPQAMRLVIPSLAQLDGLMSDKVAAQFWLNLVKRRIEPTVTSVAVHQLGKHALADNHAASTLVKLLDDAEQGSSASLALGNAPDLLLGVLLDPEHAERARKNALVGLQGTTAGSSALRNALASAPKTIRKEVNSWIR